MVADEFEGTCIGCQVVGLVVVCYAYLSPLLYAYHISMQTYLAMQKLLSTCPIVICEVDLLFGCAFLNYPSVFQSIGWNICCMTLCNINGSLNLAGICP